MIEDKDISIVVQGPVLGQAKFNVTNEMTKVVCQRLKKLFPESEIILSTWSEASANGIYFDKLVINQDPGATWFDYLDRDSRFNCNRLIVSTKAGIMAASRKYVLKVRSDLFLVTKGFLKYFNKYTLYNEDYKFVRSRIIAFSMWSIRGHKTCTFTMPKPFHISDWAYFGYKEDLLDLYDVPLVPEPEFAQWFLNRCKPFSDVAPAVLWRMPPEQHITSSFFKKYLALNLEHTADDSNNNMEKSAILLMNNFLILDHTQFSFISLKHFYFQFSRGNHEWFIYHKTWLKNYCEYIGNHSCVKKIQYNTHIMARTIYFFILYNFLRFANARTGVVNRFFAWYIKKII